MKLTLIGVADHPHEPVPEKRAVVAYLGCVNKFYCDMDAHGAETIMDWCRCDAERVTNRNGDRVEHGEWREPW